MTTRINLTKLQPVSVTNNVSRIYILEHNLGSQSSETNKNEERYRLYDDATNCAVAYVLDENNILQGRVIIWAGVYNPDEENPKTLTAYSKIYGATPHIKNILRKWCESRNMVSLEKLHENLETPKLQVYLGFYLTEGMYEEVPYVDYFQWAQQDLPFLFTFRPHHVEAGDYIDISCLDNCEGDGGFLTNNCRFACTWCGEIHDRNEMEWTDEVNDFLCPYCVEEFNR